MCRLFQSRDSYRRSRKRWEKTPTTTMSSNFPNGDPNVPVFLIFKSNPGFHNTNSQISASLTANGKFVICASEDSHVYVWKHEGDSQSRNKGITATESCEYFHCRNVSVAIPWLGIGRIEHNRLPNHRDKASAVDQSSSLIQQFNGHEESKSLSGCTNGASCSNISSLNIDKLLVTWPEKKLPAVSQNGKSHGDVDASDEVKKDMTALGMVIVTANLRGELKIFQNFGPPVRI